LTAFFLLGFFSAFSQPFTEALQINPVQRDYYHFRSLDLAKRGFLQKNTDTDTLPIPFFDDFSQPDLSWAPSRFWFGYAIRDIHFLSSSEARAYGDQGISLKSRNRGSIWERNAPSSAQDFRSVSFPSASFAWACGSNGWLAYSSDSGKTWTSITSPAPAGMRLEKVHFFSPQLGMLADSAGNVYRTGNGGQSWSNPVFPASPGFRARALAFVNANRAVVVGDSSRTAYSDDGGLTFSVSNQVYGRNRNFRNLRFVDGNLGLAIGDSGSIDLITSKNHYRFNLAWMLQRADPQPCSKGAPYK
jgi:photosystem II stability/assembly factor-like uncharacterized protein